MAAHFTHPMLGILTIGTLALTALTLGDGRTAAAAEAPVGLGTSAAFAVLGGSTVTNTGLSVIGGDLGLSPGTAVTGLPPGIVNGVVHATDAQAAQAQAGATLAYDDAAGRASTATLATLGGRTLVGGVYTGTTLDLTGTLVLDGQNDPNTVFVFQSGSALTTASSSTVSLINGALACRVFWQVTSSATLGTDSTFVGTLIALTSVTVTTGTHVEGRLFARDAAVTLDTATITMPVGCALDPPTTTTAATTTAAPTTTSATGATGNGVTTTAAANSAINGVTTPNTPATPVTTPRRGGSGRTPANTLPRTGGGVSAGVTGGVFLVIGEVLLLVSRGTFRRRGAMRRGVRTGGPSTS